MSMRRLWMWLLCFCGLLGLTLVSPRLAHALEAADSGPTSGAGVVIDAATSVPSAAPTGTPVNGPAVPAAPAMPAAAAPGSIGVDLYTIGPGAYLYARYGHSLLCVSEAPPAKNALPKDAPPKEPTKDASPAKGDCYDFGVPNPQYAEGMFWHSYRGRPIFITAKIPEQVMLDTFLGQDRTIERQRLPLTPEELKRLMDALEGSAARGDAYAYHPAFANCSTRVRDLVNAASGDRLKRDEKPTTDVTFRDIMEDGLAGHPLELAVAALAFGPMNERYPSSWEAQLVPSKLRDAVEARFGVKPEKVHERIEFQMEKSVAAGRFLLVMVGLLLWGGIALGQRDPSGKGLRIAFGAMGLFLGGLALVLELVALTCTYPETHANWLLLVLLPTDLALVKLSPRGVSRYAKVRLALLGAFLLLDLAGVVHQVVVPVLLMVAIPFVAALYASRPKSRPSPAPLAPSVSAR